LGWSPGDDREVFGTLDELADAFTLERVGTANPIFDFDKLVWLSGQHLSAWSPEKVLDEATPFLERAGVASPTELDDKREWAIGVFSLLAPRMRTLADAVSLGSYFFVEPDAYDEKGDRKQFGSREVSDRMSALADAWEHSEWNATTLEKALRAVANELGLKAKDLIHPARLAVTGIAVGPGIFELAEYVGAKQTIDRLRRAAVYIRDKFIGE
jgi:glutamyl-tRNA synthetase